MSDKKTCQHSGAWRWEVRPALVRVKTNPSDTEIYALAEEIYENEVRNEFMPPWSSAPTPYARGCLNDAAMRLGWKPKKESDT